MMIRTMVTAALLATLALNTPATAAESVSLGPAGSGVVLAPQRAIPDGYVPSESVCDPTLAEVKSRLPRDYGTSWFWAKGGSDWAGLYFPGQNIILISDATRCENVPAVAVHEWMHQLQDVTGLRDETRVAGVKRLEIVAECAARVFEAQQGWPHYRSYPETTGVPCTEVQPQVDELLSKI